MITPKAMDTGAEPQRERRLLARLSLAAMAQARPIAWCPVRSGRWQLNPAWQTLARDEAVQPPSSLPGLGSTLRQGFRQIVRSKRPILLFAPARCAHRGCAPLRWQLRFGAIHRGDQLIGVVCRLQLCAGWHATVAQGTVVPWFLPVRSNVAEAAAKAHAARAAGAPCQHLAALLRHAVHPADQPHMLTVLEQAHMKQASFSLKCRLRLPHGSYHWHRIVGRPERDASGRLTGWLGGSQDRQQHSEACRMRRTFLRLASHELNTPLTSLTLNLQLALARSCKSDGTDLATAQATAAHPTGALAPLLARALTQAKRLGDTVDSLLDVQCLMAGELSLQLRHVDLNETLHRTLDLLAPTLLQAGCRVTYDVPEPLLGQFDGARMQQVFFHLVSNVAKFAPHSHLSLVGRATAHHIYLAVQDDGPGIAKHAARSVFRLFGRGDTGRSSSGLGVGLFLSRRIVRAHGGRLSLQHKAGRGAHFLLTLPAPQRAASVQGPKPAAPEQAPFDVALAAEAAAGKKSEQRQL